MRRGPKVPQCLFKAFMETDNQECAKKLAPYLIAQEQNALKKEPSGTYQTYKHFFRISVSLDTDSTNQHPS